MKFVVDTNVLLDYPQVLEEYDVVIVSYVLREIEELEKIHKRHNDNLMYQIRRAKRYIREHGHLLNVDPYDYEFDLLEEWGLDPFYVDNILLQIAAENGWGIITNDILLEIKAKMFDIPYVSLLDQQGEEFDYKGYREIVLSEEGLTGLYQNLDQNEFDLLVNEYLIVRGDHGGVLDIFKWTGEYLSPLPRNKKGEIDLSFKSSMFGKFVPKDEYQTIAVDSIMSNDITQIRGPAGSGKSKIALEAAWALIERKTKPFDKLVIFVNPTPARNAQELGFYKGDRIDKIMQTSVGAMLKSKFGDEAEIERLIDEGILEILPFVDIRGYETGDKRTILWILEAQNLTADLIKLGLQRASENTKIIIDGDYHQQVDKEIYMIENGMKRVSKVFRGESVYGEVELKNIYRSRVAQIADKI